MRKKQKKNARNKEKNREKQTKKSEKQSTENKKKEKEKEKEEDRKKNARVTQRESHIAHIKYTYAQQQKPVSVIEYQLKNENRMNVRNVKWKDSCAYLRHTFTHGARILCCIPESNFLGKRAHRFESM